MQFFQPKDHAEYDFKEIIYEKKDWIARVTINRPHVYNCYSTPCLQEMATAFTDASWDDKIGIVIFTGAGDKYLPATDQVIIAVTHRARA